MINNPDHVLITPETCDHVERFKKAGAAYYWICSVCDSGLDICGLCGKAECELVEPCNPIDEENKNER